MHRSKGTSSWSFAEVTSSRLRHPQNNRPGTLSRAGEKRTRKVSAVKKRDRREIGRVKTLANKGTTSCTDESKRQEKKHRSPYFTTLPDPAVPLPWSSFVFSGVLQPFGRLLQFERTWRCILQRCAYHILIVARVCIVACFLNTYDGNHLTSI